ncbi:sodium/glucose cotransporter 4-like [Tubulanus polymorphus]|uniref:sodium/glucose cotransporter 4-like n=1 Tax=Tubulanus polymorphus TaxID=672921 RepID=UPI003DA35BFA
MKRGLDHWGDILVLVIYFVFVLAVGLWSMFRKNGGNVKSYFLAGRSMTWWPVGASLFASNIGSEHFIGLAGTGAAAGIAIILYEWNSFPLVILLGWFFLPVYAAAGVYTLPEYIGKRFGGERLRIYLSVLSLVLYIVTKIAVCIYAGALFIQLALGWDMYLSIAILLLITGLYTVLGGLAAVIYTDALQTVIMMIGAIVMAIIGFVKIGGYENLKVKYMQSIPSHSPNNTTCGHPRPDAFHLFHDASSRDNPWPGLLLQSSIGCLWYWCADQVIVQRALAAKNLMHAKGGSILAGYLKLFPLFLIVFPGMISRVLFPDEVGCTDPELCRQFCGNPVGCSNIAYPKLVMELLPVGLRGLLLAVMMAAIMSSLTSIFNSASSLFTMDLWRKFRKQATERELLIVGRVFIVVLCVVSILWIPLVQSSQGGQLFIYIQAIQGYLGTPVGALFFTALIWKRMNEHGAFWGILAGHVTGIIRMTLDFIYLPPQCGEEDTRPAIVYAIHYSYFGTLLIVISVLVIVAVSLLTKPQSENELAGLTWWTKNERPREADEVIAMATTAGHDFESTKNKQDDNKEIEVTPTLWRRWVTAIVGNKHSNDEIVPETYEERMAFLKEIPRWSTFLNVNGAIGLMVMFFLYGYYH